ncbi:MAG: CPBP family intramembrane metalloprotease [Chloroflexi bacterium]|nr:CPBP family intramembrane metalloprotease [Chloroflexota bacterium]
MNHPSEPELPPGNSWSAKIQQRPLVAALIIYLIFEALILLFIFLGKSLLPQVEPAFTATLLGTLVTLGGLAFLRWWNPAGFTPPRQWRDFNLYWLPAAVILLPPLVLGLNTMPLATVLYLLAAYLLTGVMEEGFYRGILLYTLEPLGWRRAALISAILFGLAHLTNLFTRSNPAIVLAQAVGAFCDGFGFAALRLRTRSIWFLILLHMLHDLLLRFTRLPAIPLDVAQVTILLFYGLYILRKSQVPA